MALRSNTFALSKTSAAKANAKKDSLLRQHSGAVERVISDAKSLSEDRKRDLNKIADKGLRQSAAR